MIQIKEIETPDTYKIRKEILRKDIPLTEKIEGDFDETTLHLGAFVNGKLVSIVTYLQDNHKALEGLQYRLAGMATLNEYQKKGIGKQLIMESLKILSDKKVEILWCNARIVALDFYKKLGFQIFGKKFDIPFIGTHYIMYKKLKNA